MWYSRMNRCFGLFVLNEEQRRSTSGKLMLQRNVKHPLMMHIWSCFSAFGFEELLIFTANLNPQETIQIYKKCLLSSSRKSVVDRLSVWVLQDDNDETDCSHWCLSWKIDNDIRTSFGMAFAIVRCEPFTRYLATNEESTQARAYLITSRCIENSGRYWYHYQENVQENCCGACLEDMKWFWRIMWPIQWPLDLVFK